MTEENTQKWFVVQIKPNSYALAKRNLERQGFKIFIPKMTILNRKNNMFITKDVYVFPGYIFVSFNPSFTPWVRINSTYGVSKILLFNKRPAEVALEVIAALKNRYDLNFSLLKNKKIRKGDSIKFLSGPFVDLIARVESVEENHRIWALFEYMGGMRKIKLMNNNKLQYSKV